MGNAPSPGVIAHKTETAECVQCDVLLSQYESAAFDLAKIHNAMDAAQHRHDRMLTRKLTLQAYDTAARKKRARAALAKHQETDHDNMCDPLVSASGLLSSR